jgi:spore maturation protein CgeB
VYGESRLTVHIPRQQYADAMHGIPTIRVFEALACGIPLISAPWSDSERLFRDGDFATARSGEEMQAEMERLLGDEAAAQAQAQRGLETVLARHTCGHRAEELTAICEEVLQ